MITREQAQKIVLKSIEDEIKKHGEDAVALLSPKKGKCSWTWKELKEAAEKDVCLEDSNINQIDSIIRYDADLIKRKGYGLVEHYKRMGKEI
jgi:hypothetical protein